MEFVHRCVYGDDMGRIQLVLEDVLYKEIDKRAKDSGASKSLIVRDLVRKGLEIEEDIVLSKVADMRMQSYDSDTAVPLAEIKRKFG
jgi:metal-responsive CopG/Arc/MetJ family transcriptional regulator